MAGNRDVPSTYFAESWLTGSVTASVGSQQVVPENPFRKNLSISNDSPNPVFVRFRDGDAGPTKKNIRIPAYELWEMMKPPITASVHIAFVGTASGSIDWVEVS